ncbi:MAG: SusC/RagA family TonB-linked outer membrane protein, partial [Chitinophagaceae bacterium]|nr:SusC/RagA family TonB-linked outer membrane protein [Chitinophagaceae bacterium]
MRKLRLLMLSGFLLAAQFLMAQTREVAGKITDGSGAPLAGVSIRVKGSNTGTSSGNDGAYSINMPKGLNSLIFSYIGYEDQEVDVKGNSMNISLSQFTRSLNEVVVIGYGSQVKRDLTGSIARVKGSDVQNMPVPNLSQALQGRAAGVFVEAQNGKVGEGIKVRIRGATSINGSNEPLYVVDGVPLVGGIFGSASADINFNDVESFDILKDASATAIYGSRAANGVILITTKRGKNGKTKFTLNTQYGTQSPTGKREFLNAAEFIELFSEAAVNTAKYHFNRAGNWRGFASEAAAITNMTTWMEARFTRYSGYSDWRTLQTNTDWQELAFDQDAKTNQIELNAQGGNDQTKFFISGSLNNQDGILIGNKFQRMGVR